MSPYQSSATRIADHALPCCPVVRASVLGLATESVVPGQRRIRQLQLPRCSEGHHLVQPECYSGHALSV